MANADIRDFYFYQKYLWRPQDFLDHQTWLTNKVEGLGEGAIGSAALSGLLVTPNGGLNVAAAAGIGVTGAGRLCVHTGGNATFASPSGNPCKSLLVLRPTTNDTNLINEPLNPVNQVPLHKQLLCTLVAINGTPSASPAYPSIVAGDIILMGIKLANGQVNIAQTDFDFTMRDTPRKLPCAIRLALTSGNVQVTDKHVDVDASASGNVQLLPTASMVVGQDFTFVKVDSSANTVAVSGQGDSISGQPSVVLEDQWQQVTVRSVGNGWRSL